MSTTIIPPSNPKKAQTVVYTVVWAAMSPPHLDTPPCHLNMLNRQLEQGGSSRDAAIGGLETCHVSSPWFFFFFFCELY